MRAIFQAAIDLPFGLRPATEGRAGQTATVCPTKGAPAGETAPARSTAASCVTHSRRPARAHESWPRPSYCATSAALIEP